MTAITVILLLVNIALLAGVGHVLYREVVTIRVTRQQAPPPPQALPAGVATIRELQTQLESQHQTELERLRAEARTTIGELHGEVEGLHADVATLHGDVGRLSGQVSAVRGGLGALPEEVERLHGELATLSEAIQALAGRSGELSEELAARSAPAQLAAHAHDGTGSPRMPGAAQVTSGAVAELYAQLARLEVAFLTLTNPVLLPGERWVDAAELPAETLRWESWKDVGDQTFGFAELYAAKRVQLEAGPRAAAGEFITAARELLTARIYPVLAGGARSDRGERAERIRGAVAELAGAIERVREALEGTGGERGAGSEERGKG